MLSPEETAEVQALLRGVGTYAAEAPAAAPLAAPALVTPAPGPAPSKRRRGLLSWLRLGRKLRQQELQLEPLVAAGGLEPLADTSAGSGAVGAELPVPLVDPGERLRCPLPTERATGNSISEHTLSPALICSACHCPAALLPPPTDVLAAYSADFLTEGWSLSWVPANTTAGECAMTTAAELPPGLLVGDIDEGGALVGYEEDCVPESLPEVGGVPLQL